MANAQRSGRGTPKMPQKELPTESPRRLTDASLKTPEEPLRRESLQASVKPQETRGKAFGGAMKSSSPLLAKLDPGSPERSSSKWKPAQVQWYTFARNSTAVSPKFGGPEAKLPGDASPEAKGSRRVSAASGKLGASPKFDSAPMKRRSVLIPSGSPTPNVSPKPGSSPKGGASPLSGVTRWFYAVVSTALFSRFLFAQYQKSQQTRIPMT
ncbi:hypothetical protein V5799_011359 [Amblyomma americanum]|uniref:Uncharacterized protein n=1 Tax=Amblyomma americanum TaxID=6943 RepID=A0AAQ4EI55_AMBAM